jgi:hypothetical protein
MDRHYYYFQHNRYLYRFPFNGLNDETHAEIWCRGGLFSFFEMRWMRSKRMTYFRARHLRHWDWCSDSRFVTRQFDIDYWHPGAIAEGDVVMRVSPGYVPEPEVFDCIVAIGDPKAIQMRCVKERGPARRDNNTQ